jgi:putative transcriptional regulator
MLRAKRALEAMLESGTAVLAVPTIEDDAALRRDLAEAGVGVTAVPEVRPVDLAALRERLRMTREQFALAYGLDPETVRNWEAGRRDPGPARAYLQAIENDPQGVLDAFVGRSMERLPATP